LEGAVRITMQLEYAVRAMIDLRQQTGRGLTRGAEIAGRQHIPLAMVEQLLNNLRRAGLIRSMRGPAGGYILARAAMEITLADIVVAVEGLQPARQTGQVELSTTPAGATLAEVWRGLTEVEQRYLRGVTLEALVEDLAARETPSKYVI
jgi:Rrf2 family iron-sulfur cluster assembly transcriptional regulator